MMNLYSVVTKMPMSDTVTVADYRTGDILIDCDAVANVVQSKKFLTELQGSEVYRLEVGKAHGDLIISVWAD